MQAAEERRKRLKLMREAGNAEESAAEVPSATGELRNPFTAAAPPSAAPSFNYYSDPLAAVVARPRMQLQADDQGLLHSSINGLPVPGQLRAPARQHTAPQQPAMTWQRQTGPPPSEPRPPCSIATFPQPPGIFPQPQHMHQASSSFVQHRPRPPTPLPPSQPHWQAAGQPHHAGRGRVSGQPRGPPVGPPGRGGAFGDRHMAGNGGRGRGRGRGRDNGGGYNDPVGPVVVACSPSMLEDPWRALPQGS